MKHTTYYLYLILLLSSLTAFGYPDPNAYWKFDETTGTSLPDEIGDNDGTLNGGAAWTTAGIIDGAIDLDPNDGEDFIQINATNDSPIIPAGSDFTISAWVKMNDTPASNMMIYGYYSSNSGEYFAYSMYVYAGDFRFWLGNGLAKETFSDLDGGLSLAADRWYHLAVTFDGTTVKGYVNGEWRNEAENPLSGTVPSAGTPGNKYELIGGAFAGTTWNFDGLIDDTKVWTQALSDSDIHTLFFDEVGSKSGSIDVTQSPYNADSSGSSDASSAIQDAIADAYVMGKSVLLSGGTFKIENTLYLEPYTELLGENDAVIINGTMNSRESLIEANHHCKIDGLTIDGNNKAVVGVNAFDGTHDLTLSNCTLRNYRGITSGFQATVYIHDNADQIRITSCNFYDMSDPEVCRGIYIEKVTDTVIDGCVFNGISTDVDINADWIQVIADPHTSNTCDPNHYEYGPSYVTVQNCQFSDFSYRAIKFQCDNAIAEDNVVISKEAFHGIRFFGDDTIIRGNVVFLIDPNYGGIVGTGPDGLIEDNTVVVTDTDIAAAIFLSQRTSGGTIVRNNYLRSSNSALRMYADPTIPGCSVSTIEFSDNVIDGDESTAIQEEISSPGNTISGNIYARASWWFDETCGSTAADSAGNNDATVTGPSWYTEGMINGCLNFDGSNDYVTIDDPNLDPNFPSFSSDPAESFSISLWALVDDLSDRRPLIAKQGNEHRGFLLSVEDGSNNDKVAFEVYEDASSHGDLVSTSTLNTGEFYHIVATYDGAANDAYLYINGVEEDSDLAFVDPPVANSENLDIGRYYWNSTYNWYFEGLIDEVQFYNSALSAKQVQAIYGIRLLTMSSYGAYTPQAHWKLDASCGDMAADAAGNNGLLLADSSSDWDDDGGQIDGALEFNGTDDYGAIDDSDLSGSFPGASTGDPNDFTLAAWVSIDTTSGQLPILSKESQSAGRGFVFDINDGKVRFTEYNAASQQKTIESTSTLSTGTFYHVAYTYDEDSDTAIIYIDGDADKTTSSFGGRPKTNSEELDLGRYYYNSSVNAWFDGLLDDVRIYDEALPESAIEDLAGQ